MTLHEFETPSLPEQITDEGELNSLLARPRRALIELMKDLSGDLMILGIAGKMGASLGQMAVEAIRAAGIEKSVYGVARFSDPNARQQIESSGIRTIQCDLLDRDAVAELPQVKNVVFMAGLKFGTGAAQPLTWAMNTLVPANVAQHFRDSNIVAFSTGCVYPLVQLGQASTEQDTPAPVGEYAQSCLGRERVFQHFSLTQRSPVCLIRLNYAVDLRYGVLNDIAGAVWRGEQVNNRVNHFNAIWQGDANHQALMCFAACSSPACIMNVAGPETLSTEVVAKQFGELMGKPVSFSTTPGQWSYLNDSSNATMRFGRPAVTAEQLIRWQAHWIMRGGRSLGKPTHFEVSDGKF